MKVKRTEPWVPVGHPDFKWVSGGADVQALWRKYGWTPPSERRHQSGNAQQKKVKNDHAR